jgi:hypothetical protein
MEAFCGPRVRKLLLNQKIRQSWVFDFMNWYRICHFSLCWYKMCCIMMLYKCARISLSLNLIFLRILLLMLSGPGAFVKSSFFSFINNLRPISISNCLAQLFERLVLLKMLDINFTNVI